MKSNHRSLRRGDGTVLYQKGIKTMTRSRQLLWIVGGLVILLGMGVPQSLLSQNPSAPLHASAAGEQLQMSTTMLPNGQQQIVILDSSQRTLAVYHVDGGNLQLRCVRSLIWDLRMEEFNGAPPLPSELRRVQP